MESSVSLQEPFSYALWPLVVTGLLALAAIIYFIVILAMKAYKKKKAAPHIAVPKPLSVEKLKQKYISELDRIYAEFTGGRLGIREAYQQMSLCIRRFVHSVTGIKVQNYTLVDIGRLNMPMLYELMGEYYAPEFARKSEGDVIRSLVKTRSMIERWR